MRSSIKKTIMRNSLLLSKYGIVFMSVLIVVVNSTVLRIAYTVKEDNKMYKMLNECHCQCINNIVED